MRIALMSATTTFLVSTAGAVPLTIVEVNAPAVNCVFDTSCTIVVTDTVEEFALPGGAGTARLQSRTFAGGPGAPAEGFFGYEYRIDLTDVQGIVFVPCVTSFAIDFGTAVSFDYDGNESLERVYVVTSGGLGTVGPSSADKEGDEITFQFDEAVCAGETSYFFGMASSHEPRVVTTTIRELFTGSVVEVSARAPTLPPSGCTLRPDLNDDLTAAQRATLSGLMQDFLAGPVLNLHFTPGIHGTSIFLPWHREYIGDLENFLIVHGHPEFVPLPKWDPAKPIPDEFVAVDADCVAPPTCAPLVDTDPGIVLPDNLKTPDLCSNYDTAEDLRLGPPAPGLESWHNGVHVSVSGAMGAFNSPAAVIFWPWHAFIDDVWRSWQCCPSIGLVPFPITTLIRRTCPIVPCWPVWFGLDDPFLLDPLQLTVGDRRGFDNFGVEVGNPRPIPGMVGGALSFDGIDDLVRVSNHPELNVGMADLSIDAWIRTSAHGFQPIVDKRGADGAGYALFLQDGRLGVYMADAQDACVALAPQGVDVADGEWHHVAATIERAAQGRLYVDSTPVLLFEHSCDGSVDNAADLLIGRATAAGASARAGGVPGEGFFAGDLDELDLFRFVLTEDEVAGIFSAGAAGKYGSLAGFEPIVFGPCLEDLRQLIVNLERVTGKNNQSLLVKIDQVLADLEEGRRGSAIRRLRSLINEADGLADIEKWERGAYESVMHKAMHCLEELEAAEIAKGGDQDSGDRVAAPPRFGLAQNSPNPFNPQTTIRLTLPRTMDYSLSIYDVAGRNIRRYAGLAGPGEISVVWDGRNAQGDLQSAGLYFFEARAGEFAEKRKMVLCK